MIKTSCECGWRPSEAIKTIALAIEAIASVSRLNARFSMDCPGCGVELVLCDMPKPEEDK